MKSQTTKKKFYNKWNYKIKINFPGSVILRYIQPETAISFLQELSIDEMKKQFYIGDRTKNDLLHNKEICLDFFFMLSTFEKDSWAKRIEGNNIDIYCNDKEIFNKIVKEFRHIIRVKWEPDGKLESNKIKVKKLPNDRYNYRVYLLPHKLKNSKEEKERVLDWIDSQDGRIKISDTVKRWFINTDWNWDPRYILVDEESTLLMLKLRNSEIVGRVYQFLVS